MCSVGGHDFGVRYRTGMGDIMCRHGCRARGKRPNTGQGNTAERGYKVCAFCLRESSGLLTFPLVLLVLPTLTRCSRTPSSGETF